MLNSILPKSIVSFCLLLLSPGLAAQAESVGLTQGSVIRAVLSLLLVLLIIFSLAFYLKRFQHLSSGTAGSLKVISSLALSPRERVVLVQVGEEQLLLGVAANSVNLLKTLEEPLQQTKDGVSVGSFSAQLEKFIGRQK